MASVLKSLHARLLVEYSQFVLFDHFGAARLVDLELPQEHRWVGHAGVGGAVFHAADRSVETLVELELWSEAPDAEPVAPEQSQFEGVFTSDSGRLELATLTGSPSDRTLELQGPGAHRVRATRLGEEFDASAEGQIESWRLHVWADRT